MLSHIFNRWNCRDVTAAEGETIQWLLSHPGVCIHEHVPFITTNRVGKNQLDFVDSIRKRDIGKFISILRDEEYLCLDARDQVSDPIGLSFPLE